MHRSLGLLLRRDGLVERLEQLRALEHDRVIQVEVAIESIPPGVDTESDLEVIRRQMEDLSV